MNRNGGSASRDYAVELVTPVLEYEDMSLLQEVVRSVRKAGGVTAPNTAQAFMYTLMVHRIQRRA